MTYLYSSRSMILLNMKIRLRSFGVSASFQHLPIALRYNLSAIIFYQLCLINVSQVLTVTTIPLQSFIFCHIDYYSDLKFGLPTSILLVQSYLP